MPITRRSLLIASPTGSEYLHGAVRDIDNFREFLKSIAGGAWDDGEIVSLIDPKLSDVKANLLNMQNADYAFITFAGHGYHVKDATQSETRICLSPYETCAVHELNPRNKRHFVVIDSCRGIVSADILEERRNAFAAVNAKAIIDREGARAAFDAAVTQAEEGRIVAYSCGINQSAGEVRQSGGIFSTALMGEAGRWALSANPRAVLDVNSAVTAAKKVTYDRNAPQMPELEAGRRLRYFPFAVGT